MAQRFSFKHAAAHCFGKNGDISVKRDILGVVADDHPQDRSAKELLSAAYSFPYVRMTIVTIKGAAPTIQKDLDTANEIFRREGEFFLYPVASIEEDRPHLLALHQNSCPLGVQQEPTEEELELFNLGRDKGADVVGYYIQNGPGGVGCSAYPEGLKGFWVDDNASEWTFAHELGHVLGRNYHVGDKDNLMFVPTPFITNPPPNLNTSQVNNIKQDDAVYPCPPDEV